MKNVELDQSFIVRWYYRHFVIFIISSDNSTPRICRFIFLSDWMSLWLCQIVIRKVILKSVNGHYNTLPWQSCIPAGQR